MTEQIDKENYIFLFRDIPDWLRQSPNAFHLLAEFASRARRIVGEVPWNGESINLEPLQFITGRLSVSQKLGLTENQYRGAYKKLLKYGLIKTIKATNQFTVGLLCCDNVFYINPSFESPAPQPTEPPAPHHQITTNNNDDNDKNVQSRLEKIEPYKESESFKRLRETAERLRR